MKTNVNTSGATSKSPQAMMQEIARVLQAEKIVGKPVDAFHVNCVKKGASGADELRFELEIAKVNNEHELKVRRVHGDAWAFKDFCGSFLAALQL